MSKTYEEPDEGAWVQPVVKGYKMECCDCGLVHNMDFRIEAGRVQFRVFRNNRATGQIRRFWDARIAKAKEALPNNNGSKLATDTDAKGVEND